MDIKDLNKSQLILLTLLVSFVTSIATGITTVTLLQQAPTGVTQTINRVIEKTIQKVVPGESQKQTETVIVKEEDLIVDAIEKNKASLVSIRKDMPPESTDAGEGFIVSADGYIISDSSLYIKNQNYFILIGDEKYKITYIGADDKGFVLFKADTEIPSTKSFSFSSFGDSDTLKVGQSILALSGDPLSISKGIISGFATDTGERLLLATIDLSKDYSGMPAIDIDGQVMGVPIIRDGKTYFYPSNTVKKTVEDIKNKAGSQ